MPSLSPKKEAHRSVRRTLAELRMQFSADSRTDRNEWSKSAVKIGLMPLRRPNDLFAIVKARLGAAAATRENMAHTSRSGDTSKLARIQLEKRKKRFNTRAKITSPTLSCVGIRAA